MKIIAIDTRWIRSVKMDGIGRYGLNLLKWLILETNNTEKYKEFRFLALFDKEEIMNFVREEVGDSPNLEMVLTPNKLFSFMDLFSLPWFLKKRGVSLYHALNMYFSPFCFSCITIVTIHDLIPVINPPPFWEGSFLRKFFFSYKPFLSWLIGKAGCVIADSQSTKRDVERLFSYKKNKVVYPGIQSDFAKKPLPEQWEEFCTQRGLFKPFILFVGRMDRHKGVLELFKAYESFPDSLKETYTLVFVGKKKGPVCKDALRVLQKDSDVLFLGHVDEEELCWLYSMAELFSFPSLYEGFGLPLLEAMASGVPIVAGDNSSIPEIARGAAILADPKDTEFYKTAMIVCLTNEKIRKKMITIGKKIYLKFSWKGTAEQVLLAYDEMLND